MALAWFLRVFSNSSSFSAILRSISCLVWPSSSWARRTLFSSASKALSASPKQLEVLPFLLQDDDAACPTHGWIFLHLPIDQGGP